LTWGKFLEAVIIAVCFSIAVVPENFSARIALMLSLGIKRLQKDRATIFDSSTVEKLAGVTVICADKTGTLTQNKMILREVFDGSNFIDLSCDNISKQCEVAMRFGALSCDAQNGEIPDHTEAALVSASARYLNIVKTDFDSEFPRMNCIPLTPERKIKTTVNMIEGKPFAIVRGAPDIVLELCVDADTEIITKAYEEMCSKGMRVLAISYKILDDVPSEASSELLENGLQFLGLLGLTDRERRGTSDEIALCRKAGISTVMFTGDHINTASSVAEQMGILQSDDLAITGEHLDELNDEELLSIVKKIKVCARFSPEQRVRFVNALHSLEETVLITADSAANHAPMAIADVGCAMGKTGTDVAKGNADIVVADDRFISIVRAIKNSRGIFANFTKYAEYYVTLCTAVFTTILLCMIFFGVSFLSPQLILLGSIFTLIFPVSALGFETADNSTMTTPPWNIGSKMFDVRRIVNAALIGVGVSLPAFLVYILNQADGCAGTAGFLGLLMSMIYYAFTSRSNEMFYRRIFHNRFLLIAGAICFVVAILIVSTSLAGLFGLSKVCLKGFFTSILIPLSIPAVFEIFKLVKKFKK
ncbi:MAG: cation-transporting P-type ATPase, partial [Clostridia bacterium]|nr:cation-transporting P-type ATPase [Clostridia bacterium]